MIKIENLSKTFRGNSFKSVDDLSLEIEGGEIFGFLGPNGAGKSTTIKCLTGIYKYDSGKISICGVDLKENPIEAKKHIGYVPDEHIAYEGLKAIEYINFIADIFEVPINIRKERTEHLTNLFGLSDRLNENISSYSHGMKQKLSIITALIHDPEVWILDEPMLGLDPQSAFNLKQLMSEHIAKGKTVFFSSHVLEVVEKICTKVAIVDHGKLLAVGKIDELKKAENNATLEKVFLDLTSQADESYNEHQKVTNIEPLPDLSKKSFWSRRKGL